MKINVVPVIFVRIRFVFVPTCRAESRALRVRGVSGGGSIETKQCSERFLEEENEQVNQCVDLCREAQTHV
jgi:hypothetical protein